MTLLKKKKKPRFMWNYANVPHVDLVESGEHGVGVLSILQTLSNAHAHSVGLDTDLITSSSDGVLWVDSFRNDNASDWDSSDWSRRRWSRWWASDWWSSLRNLSGSSLRWSWGRWSWCSWRSRGSSGCWLGFFLGWLKTLIYWNKLLCKLTAAPPPAPGWSL